MQIDRSNAKAFHGSLEDVFMHGLTAPELRQVHDTFFYKALKKPEPKKKKRKAEMAAALMELSLEPTQFAKCIKALPTREYEAYALLVWLHSSPVTEAEAALGFPLHQKQEERNWRQSYSVFCARPEFNLLAIGVNPDRPNYNGYSLDQTVDNYVVQIAPAVRKWLKPHFPKPDGYEIEPLPADSFTSEAHTLFDASQKVVADLADLIDFLQRGSIEHTKTGSLAKTSIRKAAKLIKSGEWYPDKKTTPKLTLMRAEMLIDFAAGFTGSLSKRLSEPQPKASIVKALFNEIQRDTETVAKWLMIHLKFRYKYYEEHFDDAAMGRLFDLFGRLTTETWVTTENLKNAQFHRDIDILFYEANRYVFLEMTGRSGYSYETQSELVGTRLQPVGIDPLIDGMAFLLSAFGFVELAYQLPRNETYSTKKAPYLTPYDGALAVRLTELGAYIYGQTDTLALELSDRKVARVQLHPERLCASCQNLDPITELALKDYMEQVGHNFYKMTRASMLKNCKNPHDVRKRVAEFRKRIPAECPPNWETFLEGLKEEGNVLRENPSLCVFTLEDQPDLQRHFLQDPILRRLALRVEGHRVAINYNDLSTVRSHLRKLGYLVES